MYYTRITACLCFHYFMFLLLQAPHHHVAAPNIVTSLDEWWDAEISTIMNEVNIEVSKREQ